MTGTSGQDRLPTSLLKSKRMNTKLFFVCPFSHAEALIRYEYGNNAMFATSAGAVPQFHEEEYAQSIISLVRRHGVTDLYLAADTECRFMNAVLGRREGYGMPCEAAFRRVFNNHMLEIVPREGLGLQQKSFAILHIIEQARAMMAHEGFRRCAGELGLRIHGVVTTRSERRLTEFNISNSTLVNGLSSFSFQLN